MVNSQRVPSVFTWTQGGNQVYVTGTFNNWAELIPLNKSEKDFTTILDLPPGVHQYKFLVDNKWKHAPDQPMTTDLKGNINNCLEVKTFTLDTKSVLGMSAWVFRTYFVIQIYF